MEDLFERRAKQEYNKLHNVEKKPRGKQPVFYTFCGVTKTAKEWAEILELTTSTILQSISLKSFDARYKQKLKERGVL